MCPSNVTSLFVTVRLTDSNVRYMQLVELNALYKARGEDAHTKSRDVSSVVASFDVRIATSLFLASSLTLFLTTHACCPRSEWQTRLKEQEEQYEKRLLSETTARQSAEAVSP